MKLTSACDDDLGCSLNGVCENTFLFIPVVGHCKCDAEWTGEACERLNLLPPPSLRAAFPPPGTNATSWGASVIEAAGKFHMYCSVMANACGMTTWTRNSFIQHGDAAAAPLHRAKQRAAPARSTHSDPSGTRTP